MDFHLSQNQIKRFVGPSFFERGLEYFQRGMVISAYFGDESISGLVRGSEHNKYRAEIFFSPEGISWSECECPMEGNCKHVAALYLAAMDKQKTRPDKIVDAEFSVVKQPDDWRQMFAVPAAEVNDAEPVSGSLRLCLRLEKTPEYLIQNGHNEPEWQLQIRPVVYNHQTGKTVISAVSWQDVLNRTYRFEELNIPARQKDFLRNLALSFQVDYRYGQTTWKAVDNKNAATFWNQLRHADVAGLELVAGEKGDEVISLNKQRLGVILNINDVKGGVELSGALSADGQSFSGQDNILVYGLPPVFAVSAKSVKALGRHPILFPLAIHPVEEGYGEHQSHWLGRVIRVPTADIKKFSAEFLPQLVRSVKIINNSSRISLPEIGRPTAVIKIERSSSAGIAVSLWWDYGGARLPINGRNEILKAPDHKNILRDLALEKNIYMVVAGFLIGAGEFFVPGKSLELFPKATLLKTHARDFLDITLPMLAAQPNIVIEKAGNLPDFKEAPEEPKIEFSVDEHAGDSGQDWFDLSIKISVEGQDVPFAEVFGALAAGEGLLFLESGRYIKLDSKAFLRLKNLIEEARHLSSDAKGSFTVSRYQAGWWDELRELGIITRQAAAWQNATKNLLSAKGVKPVKPPGRLQATLRPYQQEGFSWMQFLRQHSLGGILADDMGLGKTVQTIAVICAAAGGRAKFLIVAPTSVVENWDMELQRFAPYINRVVLRKGDRAEDHRRLPEVSVVVTSYSLLLRDFEILKKQAWDTIILDEAQFIKNHQAKAHNSIRKLGARVKIALTGTPMENNLMELWSLFSVVAPGLFASPEQFQDAYRRPIEKENSAEMLQQLRRRVRPFMLRRKKELVEKDLPAKTEQVLFLDMEPQQRHVYDLQLQHERQKVLGLLASGGLKANRFEILTSLMRLRQLCLHGALVNKKYADVPSVKLDALMEQLGSIVAEGHKVLVFSQFTSFLQLVKQRLDAAGLAYSYLDGSTRDRKGAIKKFTDDAKVGVFLISLKAGGVGLNLTAADYCIVLDPWWNPAVESQAINRAHRIGQTKHVFVYKFIAKNTIEEKVLKLQQKKQKLFANVIDEGGLFGSLVTEDDIRGIFE